MEEERRLLNERKRNILLLISQYLKDNGMFYTSASLEREALYNARDYQLCDNVDLDSIYLEYVSYYNLKFGKTPKIVKKSENIQQVQMKRSQSVNLERQSTLSGQKKSEDKKPPKIEETNLNTSLAVAGNVRCCTDRLVGTGKSALAKALFSETKCRFNFFNVSSSTITSKWRGDSEKFIRVLFDVAKFYAPSIVLFEEIDGLTSCRDVYEHESAKRFKNEFLAQIDGLYDISSNICILGTTNLPWDIDPAFLRRFEQKLLIGLPNTDERMQLIQHFLPLSKHWSNVSKTKLSDLTKGLTGDEIRIGCKEATMQKIRQAISTSESHSAVNPKVILQPKLEPVTDTDLERIFELMKPTSKLLLEKHVQWSRQYNK
ncbi:hypothetical protein HA402_015612 [Bradysia odoriphaga]|nr:hypothetical protein HA402_015612 [Bradysia odoriphaga]